MLPVEYIRQAQQVQADNGNQSLASLLLYQKAIENCNGVRDEYELLYASYQCMWIAGHHDVAQAVQYARNCLALLQTAIQAGSIMYFTEMGQFQQEVIRYATNCIGWNTYESVDGGEELENLLDLVSMGCQYATDPSHFYIFDTKTRILLKLGRQQEAFNIIRSCLKKSKHSDVFGDLAQNKEYLDWLKDAEQGIVTDLSADELEFLQKAARVHQQFSRRREEEGNNYQAAQTSYVKEIITCGEAKKRFGISNYHQDNDSILLLKGNVVVNGRLDNSWRDELLKGMDWSNMLYGVIVDGDLFVNGDVIDEDAIELYVTGALTCNRLFSRDGIMIIFGNAEVKHGVYGEYNDGSLDIYGKLTTPYILCYDHSMPSTAEGEFVYIEGGHGVDRDSIAVKYGTGSDQYYGEDCQKIFSPAVWDESDEFSIDNFFQLIENGENPFIKIPQR